MLEATYNVLDVMKMKWEFVSKIVRIYCEKNFEKIKENLWNLRLKPENLQKGKFEKISSGLLVLVEKKILLWFRNLLKKLENEDPSSWFMRSLVKNKMEKSESQKFHISVI